MNDIFIYLIKVNTSLIVFYLCYKLFFQRDTFWKVRRYYLLAGVIFSFFYPLVSMQGWLRRQEPIMTAIASIRLDEFVITPDGAVKSTIFTLENVLWTVFGIVAMLMFIRVCIQFVSIIRCRLKGQPVKLYGVDVISIHEKLTPFSFFKWIFINPVLHNYHETAEILEHEQTHARQWHSLDVIIGQLQTLLCWVNPAAWLLEREIRYNLEFLADNQVLKSGFEPKKYQYHLLQLTYEPADSKLANNFNILPIKKRIKMMNTKKTKKSGLLKYALIIPVALAMLIVSNMQEMMASAKTFVENVASTDKNPAVTADFSSERVPELQTPEAKKDVKIAAEESPATRNQYDIEQIVVVGYGQKQTQNTPPSDQKNMKIFETVETMPQFPGGEAALIEWLGKNIKYPLEAQSKKIEGKVFVQFVVSETGKVLYPKIIRGVDPSIDAEAIRVVTAMPDWTPGKQGGDNVNVRFVLPIQFKLTGTDKTKSELTLRGEIQKALIMVDGEEVSKEEMDKIMPADIESVTVLKDESATSVYGEKGKNGVIVITTKKNKALPVPEKNKTQEFVSERGTFKFDNPPAFPGGEEAMYKFLSQNVIYPVKAQEGNIQGVVKIDFLVDENGNITEPRVIQSAHLFLDNEALRIVKNMPRWTPATLKGQKVKSVGVLPMTFRLN